ncbi:CCC motif membrane protein [Hyunsoonleella pacifica]|uniref:DUF4190 domain-containing protein n=1 Tax=Hyunsoonleella pacifica TaxID=1080224 RepID=A0A4Q9FQY3_9FLAO|nr:CCC motif membrane protein [Hyunsoonleella pacifica]TBN17881.1 DUF4190 domain-containing protein [Hyunsoonleella pacifica]GGD08111.1 hypothetical protein GCM10011368_07610 [Hyunsoonleella pacifica]
MEQQKLPNSTLILVFGILSIVTCCCYGIVGLILGIVAIILAKKATQVYSKNPEQYSGFQNVKTGKILAIIGIVLSALTLIYFIWIFSVIGIEGMQDQELMQEKIREMMGG